MNKKILSALTVAIAVSFTFSNISAMPARENTKYIVASGALNTKVSQKIVLSHNQLTLAAGQTVQLKANIESTASNGKTGTAKLVWKSDKPASVTVDAKGNIKAVKPGSKAVITVSSSDKSLKAVCNITVLSHKEAENCVAIIDNRVVTKQEYILYTRFYMNQLVSSNSTDTIKKVDWSSKLHGLSLKDQVKKEALDNIQQTKILLIKAKEAGIVFDSNDQKAADAEIEKEIQLYGSIEAANKALLDAYGVTLLEYKEIYKDFLFVQKYIDAELRKYTVTDKEAEEYYKAHKDDYDTVTVTHILISTVDSYGNAVSEDKKLEAEKKAQELLARVNAGEDIKDLAEKYSEDPGVKENRGEYTFVKGEMVKSFEDWAFSHLQGETGVVESPYGFHVMKMEKRVERPFTELKDKIKASLNSTKFNDAFSKKMDTWKKQTQFEILINQPVMEKTDKALYGIK